MGWRRGKCIGKGAFGTVHVAVEGASGRAFAVKSVDAKGSAAAAAAVACLESEIRILRSLSSPYVVAYVGDDTTGASRNLHMELVHGGTAAEAAAARRGGLGERAARRVLRRVAAALRYLHDVAGVVHGDVKGRNVLVDGGGGGAKLADFGAARLVSEPAPRGPRGTPAWMAPEVARGAAPTPASDVWSLGCTAVELLTGKRPWAETGGAFEVAELMFLIGFGRKRPDLPACLSDPCRDFLDKCLHRDAGERWTCEQLLRHPFLAADSHDAAGDGEPSPSPRAVLDWAASYSDSDATPEVVPAAGTVDHDEVIARAKGRIAELASDGPTSTSWVRGWESGPACAADAWAPQPILETSTGVAPPPVAVPPPSPSSADVDGPAAAAVSGRDGVLPGAGFCCDHSRSWCSSSSSSRHRSLYHHNCGAGVVAQHGWRWPAALAVAAVPVPLLLLLLLSCILSHLIRLLKNPYRASSPEIHFHSPYSFLVHDFFTLRRDLRAKATKLVSSPSIARVTDMWARR